MEDIARELLKVAKDMMAATVFYDIYENKQGSRTSVYQNKDMGKEPSAGTSVSVDNDYGLEFKNERELKRFLKKNKYKHVGVDKDHF